MKSLPLSTRRGFSIDSLDNDKDFPSSLTSFPSLNTSERTADEFKQEHSKVFAVHRMVIGMRVGSAGNYKTRSENALVSQ